MDFIGIKDIDTLIRLAVFTEEITQTAFTIDIINYIVQCINNKTINNITRDTDFIKVIYASIDKAVKLAIENESEKTDEQGNRISMEKAVDNLKSSTSIPNLFLSEFKKQFASTIGSKQIEALVLPIVEHMLYNEIDFVGNPGNPGKIDQLAPAVYAALSAQEQPAPVQAPAQAQ